MPITTQGYINISSFPLTGVSNVIYIDLSNGNTYKWNGSVYITYPYVTGFIQLGNKDGAWFSANPNLLLLKGQYVALLGTGLYKLGDGITALSALPFLGNMTTIQDGLQSGGTILISGNNVSIGVSSWLISPNIYATTSSASFLNITLSSAGNQRYIGFYGNTSNAIVKVEGVEAAIASYPTTPINSIVIGYVLVGDAQISSTPDLTGYEEKINKVNTISGNETNVNAYPNVPAMIAYILANNPTLTLSDVLANGALTGGIPIASNDGKSTLTVENGDILAGVFNSGTNTISRVELYGDVARLKIIDLNTSQIHYFEVNISKAEVRHSTKIELNSPLIEVSQAPTTALGIVTKQYADALVAGLLDLRGSFTPAASSAVYPSGIPSSGGSGTSGAILKGDTWFFSANGFVTTKAVKAGGSIIAKVDNPASFSDWDILETNIGYVPEDESNKTGTVVGNEASTSLYLHVKGYYDYLVGFTWLTDSIFGTWINGLTSKTTPVDADSFTISDSADTNKAKKVSLTNLWTNWLKSKTDAAYNAKGFRGLYAYQNTDSSVTGSTSQTVLANIKITGGDMGANGKMVVNATGFKTGTAGNFTLGMYVSTVGTNTIGSTGVPTSSTQIGVLTSGATTLFVGTFSRTLVNKNSASSNYVFPSNQSAVNDYGVNTVARTAININTANDYWVVITGQLGNSGDTGGFDNIQVYIDK